MADEEIIQVSPVEDRAPCKISPVAAAGRIAVALAKLYVCDGPVG